MTNKAVLWVYPLVRPIEPLSFKCCADHWEKILWFSFSEQLGFRWHIAGLFEKSIRSYVLEIMILQSLISTFSFVSGKTRQSHGSPGWWLDWSAGKDYQRSNLGSESPNGLSTEEDVRRTSERCSVVTEQHEVECWGWFMMCLYCGLFSTNKKRFQIAWFVSGPNEGGDWQNWKQHVPAREKNRNDCRETSWRNKG